MAGSPPIVAFGPVYLWRNHPIRNLMILLRVSCRSPHILYGVANFTPNLLKERNTHLIELVDHGGGGGGGGGARTKG